MHTGSVQMQVVLRVTTAQGDVTARLSQRVFHHSAWKPDTAIVARDTSRRDKIIDPALWRITQANGFKRFQSGLVDLFDLIVAQGAALATGHAGFDRACFGSDGGSSGSATRRASAGTAGNYISHVF